MIFKSTLRFFVTQHNDIPEGPPREVGCRIPTTKITVRETFTTSVEELYNALTSQEVRLLCSLKGVGGGGGGVG